MRGKTGDEVVSELPFQLLSPRPLRCHGFLWRGVSREEVKACVRACGLISGNIRPNRLTSKEETFSGFLMFSGGDEVLLNSGLVSPRLSMMGYFVL